MTQLSAPERLSDELWLPQTSIFVTGSSRSGTELLRSLLNQHPGVFIAPETHYFDDLRAAFPANRIAHPQQDDLARAMAYFTKLQGSAYGLDGAQFQDLDPDALSLLERTATAPGVTLDDLFAAHCAILARAGGKPPNALMAWGEKTPRHIFRGREVLTAFPQAKIVFMLRDPRAVVASYRDWQNNWLNRAQASFDLQRALDAEERRVRRSYSLTVATLLWCSAVSTATSLLSLAGPLRVRIVSFEQLLENSETVLEGLGRFLGFDLRNHARHIRRVNSSYTAAAGTEGFDRGASKYWQSVLSEAEVWYIERLAGRLMDRHGYSRVGCGRHMAFALREVLHTATAMPGVVSANHHRIGSLNTYLLRRLLGLIVANREGPSR